MPLCEPARPAAMLLALVSAVGCRQPELSVDPDERPTPRAIPELDDDEQALLASLLADDPSDFYAARARVWRLGPARWRADGPVFARDSEVGLGEGRRETALEQPLELVVVDHDGPRVLLPLADLGRTTAQAPSWASLRVVAQVEASDLVTGLTRELHPTPWLTLSAGVGLTPIAREDQHLRVSWSDPACGFGLELALDPEDFGPLYEPGPSGRPGDEPELDEASNLRVAAGAQLFADADGREPTIRLDPIQPRESERLSAAQRVRLIGAPLGKAGRKLQQIELRCRGVAVSGYVAPADLVELAGRFAVVESTSPSMSTCEGLPGGPIEVPRGTVLYEPVGEGRPVVVGVVADDVEVFASLTTDGWWRACVGSPWGDMVFDFPSPP